MTEILIVTLQPSKFDKWLTTDEASPVVQCLANCIRLIQHLHYVVVVNARWFLDLNDLLLDHSQFVMLNLILNRNANNLLVINVVIVLGIVLEDSGV